MTASRTVLLLLLTLSACSRDHGGVSDGGPFNDTGHAGGNATEAAVGRDGARLADAALAGDAAVGVDAARAADADVGTHDAATAAADAADAVDAAQAPDGGAMACNGIVYVVDETGMLATFDPTTLAFSNIGMLACKADSPTAVPFSMAIDHSGLAWVLYDSGELFKVDLSDASCTSTPFKVDQSGFDEFSMAFVTDGTGGETLYVGSITGDAAGVLGKMDLDTLTISEIAALGDLPDLTGTPSGQLWAFLSSEYSFAQVEPGTGAIEQRIAIPSATEGPASCALASWGGDFWLFLQYRNTYESEIFRIETDGTVTSVGYATNRKVVGAGVGPCVP